MDLQIMLDYKGLINLNDWIKGFFILNKFWLIWFIYYFVHNIIKILAGVRSTIQNRKISKFWIIFIHLLPIIIILYWLHQLFFTTNDSTNTLTGLFISILFSNLIELFYTVTTNMSYFNNDNINIVLEIIPIFYSLHYYNSCTSKLMPFGLDLFYVLFNRLSIHFLEVFDRRNWHLAIDLSINIFIFFIFFYDNDCFASQLTKIRLFPKIASVLYCIVSQLLYFFHLSNNDKGNDIWSLFINQYQSYKDKSFQEFVMSLATSHATNGSINPCSCDIYGNRVCDVVDTGSYMISGYLNQYKVSPLWKKYNPDENTNENGNRNTDLSSHYSLENAYLSLIILVQWTLFNIVQRLKQFRLRLLLSDLTSLILSICKKNSDNKRNTKSISNKREPKNGNKKTKDLNKLVTAKNYSKFFLRTKNDNSNDNRSSNPQDSLFLLPDFDSSEDYSPDNTYSNTNKNDELYDTESWALSQEVDSEETLTLHDELWQLLLSFKDNSNPQYCYKNTNEELLWQISMWSLLRHQLIENKRLTRSMYAKESSKELISEITSEQRIQLDDIILNDFEEIGVINETGETDEIDDPLVCPICCLNPRNVILWPCQCLTVCDECRLKLGHRAIKNCISCDKHVQGYTRVNFV